MQMLHCLLLFTALSWSITCQQTQVTIKISDSSTCMFTFSKNASTVSFNRCTEFQKDSNQVVKQIKQNVNWTLCLNSCCQIPNENYGNSFIDVVQQCQDQWNSIADAQKKNFIIQTVCLWIGGTAAIISFIIVMCMTIKKCKTMRNNALHQRQPRVDQVKPPKEQKKKTINFEQLAKTLKWKSNPARKQLINSVDCNICLDAKPNVILPCNHAHHDKCLISWLQRKPECPLCRSLVTARTGVEIYCSRCSQKYLTLKATEFKAVGQISTICMTCRKAEGKTVIDRLETIQTQIIDMASMEQIHVRPVKNAV